MAGLDAQSGYADFVDRHGLDAFPHAVDPDGTLWQSFGSITRSAFIFVNDDGTTERTEYGAFDEDDLNQRIDELVAR